ncbi:MAG TPA: 2-C-methyl-D-erythritol 4-phosphate cytidylyltransferase [Alphaproteobacteria bacterium]|nr:2-C-methyl-D-erythritol 4-phosphate cytidylyltransferase [Alphaproteobacteria bacterium]
MTKRKKCTAIVLAGGKGKRMKADTAKQYLLLSGKPILYYSLKVFEDSFVDEVVLVAGKGEIPYCRTEIVNKYGLSKVSKIVEGGRERYHSVAAGLLAIEACDYVFIHDGARPFITEEILKCAYEAVDVYQAAVVAVPAKDTVKIADEDCFAKETPNRSRVWLMQTPQVFSFFSIKAAYEKLLDKEQELLDTGIQITDDAMVMETFGQHRIKFVEGSYRNMKITTPEDLKIAEVLL